MFILKTKIQCRSGLKNIYTFMLIIYMLLLFFLKNSRSERNEIVYFNK